MAKESTFGAEPEDLKRLFSVGLEKEESEEDSVRAASLNLFMEKPGGQIGRYKLLNILAEGGMGIVYLAKQTQPIKRKVALKVIKPGMDSARVIARFEAERQALALLDHPNIAHVYDAGTTEAGRPYFVMEYVEGLPITEHCDKHKLTIDERLKLFLQVCHAVHHAHQKGIIHRDIKPSNILVSIQDDKAIPKIIDFGVAKALSQPLTERTLITEHGQLFGTPEYMSPEQADMASEDIDTRSDIYSLGVLLYVLLTGVLPFDSKTLREGGIDNIRQVIREVDTRTPSTRLTKLGEEAKKIAENRRTEIRTLAKHLHKELEWIPLKAMRKERTERYRSASELADDIENYLKGAPLIAGPPSTVYRVKKFVKRHKALVTGIAAVLVVLIAGIIVSTIFAVRAERNRAEAQSIADFLQNDVLASVQTDRRMGQEMTVSYLLDSASERMEGKFRDKPLVEASIRYTLGLTYRDLRESAKAEHHLKLSYEIRRQHLGPEHLDTIKSISALGWVYRDQGRLDDAEKLWTELLEIVRKTYGPEHQMATGIMNHLGNTYEYQGRIKEAKEMLEEVLEINERVRGDRHFHFYASLNLACLYRNLGRYEESEQLFLEALEVARQRWGPNAAWTLTYTLGLVDLYRNQGRYGEAEQLCETTLETARQIHGAEHWTTLWALTNLGRLRIEQDRFNEAEPLLREALEGQRRLVGNENRDTLVSMNALAVLLTKQKRYDEAESLFEEALKGRQRELGEDHPYTLETKNDLGVLYKEQARYDEAEPLLLEAVEGRIQKLGLQHPHTIESINNLIELYEAWGKPEKAKHWRTKFPRKEDTQ